MSYSWKDFVDPNDSWANSKKEAVKRLRRFNLAKVRIEKALAAGKKPSPEDLKLVYNIGD